MVLQNGRRVYNSMRDEGRDGVRTETKINFNRSSWVLDDGSAGG